MNYSSAKLLAVVLLVLVQWDSVTAKGAERGCWEEERLALLQINATLTIPIYSADGEWKGTDCCRWERVTCDRTTGHVTELDLSIQQNSDGDEYYIPDYELFLNATIFLPLHELKYLSLSGHEIPGFVAGAGVETWSNLTNLEVLNLSGNNLSGSIIFPLARILSLRKLILSFNYMGDDGAPIEGFESWTNSTRLEMLDLSYNNIYITKRFISSFSAIKSLRVLYLNDSICEDHIPVREFSALNLEVLSLRDCWCFGSLPNLGALSSLKALSLAGNFLSGTLNSKGLCNLNELEELDLSFNNFTGNLPLCLCKLNKLEELDLSFNNFTGNLPLCLCKLNKLEEIDLSDNSFSGNLPLCMGNMSSLKLIDLSANEFQVQFPSNIFERLVFLRFLSLSDNQLEGTLSIMSFLNHSNLEVLRLSTQALNFRVEVVNMPFQLQELILPNCVINVEPTFLCSQHKLQVLDLSNTQSKGPIPVAWLLENNTNLNQLDLHKNFFTGPLQLPLPTHKQLSHLDISDNLLGGEIPIDITAKLPNLLFLNLSKNFLQGPLPLISIGNLMTLDLSINNLSQDIQNVSSMISASQNILDVLNLSCNRLYGSLTNNTTFTQVSTLLLSDNNIRGEIPFSFCNTNFEVLDISNNKLIGILPDCIGIATISALKLSGNYLEGSLPSQICGIKGLLLLDLSNNMLFGPIPSCSNRSELQIVKLSQNNLIGNFPITWLNISSIKVMDIQDNHLSGELPMRISTESNLIMLQASKNLFEGQIPQQLCQLNYLHMLDLSGNNLFGQVPSCIINMGVQELSDINIHYYHPGYPGYPYSPRTMYISETKLNYKLQLMSKGRLDTYWDNILSIEGLIDLSSNKLVGNIPNEIGQMTWLVTLNLSNNHFNGSIPISISNLSQLQSLDLSHNSLTGEIPRDMTKLTSLESFSVAYNNLSGPTVDMKAQFGTFDNSSYEGNPNLCGPPLSKSCFPTLGTAEPPPIEMNKGEGHESTDFLILFGSVTLFFVISFWGFMVVLYFKRNWRYTLFTLADRYGDMIYVRVVLLVRKIGAARTERDN